MPTAPPGTPPVETGCVDPQKVPSAESHSAEPPALQTVPMPADIVPQMASDAPHLLEHPVLPTVEMSADIIPQMASDAPHLLELSSLPTDRSRCADTHEITPDAFHVADVPMASSVESHSPNALPSQTHTGGLVVGHTFCLMS